MFLLGCTPSRAQAPRDVGQITLPFKAVPSISFPIEACFPRHCGICPRVTANLVRVRKLLGDRVGREIFMYSITLKPKEDSPEALRDYARRHGVRDEGRLFLTGTPGDIDYLRRALGFAYSDPVEDADVSNHAGMLRFGVEAVTRWGACPGMANPEHIARTILWDLG